MIIKQLIRFFLLALMSTKVFALVDPQSRVIDSENFLPFHPGRLLVKFKADAPKDAIEALNSFGAHPTRSYKIVPGLWLYEHDEQFDVEDVVAEFRRHHFVEYAEPDYFYRAATLDARFNELWGMENTGQTGGIPDADINANSMWAITPGNSSIVVGVIDSGVDYTHADLLLNLWKNVLDLPGTGIDEDGNGYVDDVFGINAITNNGNPFDDNAHGTHVSGTIGAVANNVLGVTGVAQNVQIVNCKFLGSNGIGSTADAIQCLQYFAALKTRAVNPVNIVATNNSWGSTTKSIALQDAVRAHRNLDILFVAAAGNDGANNDVRNYFPANIDEPNVLSVAATDHRDLKASFSNYGRRTVHVGAPGSRILSTVPNQGYALFSGTSMAAPHVAGLAVIVKSRFPALDYRGIKNLIISSGTPLSTLASTTISGRRIRGADTNGRGALTCTNQLLSSRLTPLDTSLSTLVGRPIFLSAVRVNCGTPAGPITLYTSSTQSIILQDNGLNGDLVAGDGIYSLLWTPTLAGNYALNFGNNDIVNVFVLQNVAPAVYSIFKNITFSYENITGTSLNVSDESTHQVTAPFPIRFAGSTPGLSTLWVGSNGTISFSSAVNPGYNNTTLPTNALATLVAPLWDDLTPATGVSNVFTATSGVAPNRKFVVEWRNMRHFNTSGTATFQVVFYENSSDIRFNYLDTLFNHVSYDFGRSATIGVQTSSNSAAQASFNTANAAQSGTSILFRLP